MDKQEEFFIRISEPAEIRRNLLQSSKTLLACMQSHEKVKRLRERKMEQLLRLRSIMRETAVLLGKFRGILPKERLTAMVKKYEQHAIGFESAAPKEPSGTELEALEREIAQIEERLVRI